MKKSILIFFWIIYLLFNINLSYGLDNVEKVFSDIDKNYIYYHELETLYNKWMISPDSNWRFNPYKLLDRDEFVWITMEASCKNCIIPDIDIEYIEAYYNTKPFFDLNNSNKNFYCIAESKENDYVAWYNVSDACQNWVQKDWEAPFCVDNKIKLEEAIAIIMNNSWLLSSEENRNIINRIESWENFPDLANDLKAKNSDWSPYSFYGYFRKALNYELIEYNNLWNKRTYKLIEIKDWRINPDKQITKQDFLYLAYILLKTNSCKEKEAWNIPLKIEIFDKSCDKDKEDCDISLLDDESNTYDFKWTTKETYIREWNIEFTWRFFNNDTWEEIIKKWEYIDNFNFISNWDWDVFLYAKDENGNYGSTKVSLNINNNKNSVIKYKYIWDNGISFLTDDTNWSTYSWDFWDWSNPVSWNDIDHSFPWPGTYTVTLTTTDSNWNSSSTSTTITIPSSSFSSFISSTHNWDNSTSFSANTSPSWNYNYSWDFWDWSNPVSWNDIDHSFPWPWTYTVSLTTTDSNWNSSSTSTTITILPEEWIEYTWNTPNENDYISTYILANPTNWNNPLTVYMTWIINKEVNELYNFEWDFWDGEIWYGRNLSHTYLETWTYEIRLTVTEWENIWTSSILIRVHESEVSCNEESDNDWDLVNDCDDKCPDVTWSKLNSWCPIFDEPCTNWCQCEDWYTCSTNDLNVCDTEWICLIDDDLSGVDNCYYDWKTSLILWNAICNACPCPNFLDFKATVRTCDYLLPAITSPDSSEIYSEADLYRVE